MGATGRSEKELAHGVVGSARVIAFGASNVAPAGAVVGGLIIVVSYAGYASPLVVLVAFAASLCCANSIAQFARRLPSAGSLYTYNCRGLGRIGGFLTGWTMVFAYLLYVPAATALSGAYLSQLLADTVHLTVRPWVLFIVILGAVAVVAYLGIALSSSADLVLVAGEVAVITTLAITILVKVGPSHYSIAILSPSSSPTGQVTDLTTALIYGITAFSGFEAAAALGEEARNTRRTIPAATIGVVVVTGLFYLLVVCAEMFGVGRHGTAAFAQQNNPLGYLTRQYWSSTVAWLIELVVVVAGLGFVIAAFNATIRVLFAMGREHVLPGALSRLSGRRTPHVAIACVSLICLALGLPMSYVLGGARTFGYLAGAGGLAVVLVYLAVNIAAIRAFRTQFRAEFRPWPHLLMPAIAAVLFLLPLWGILHPHHVSDILHFAVFAWLVLGVIVAWFLRSRQTARYESLGRLFLPADATSD